MAKVTLKLRSRHRKWFSRYSTTRCIVSTALRETYGGDWVVGYGTARRKGFFTGTTLRMGMRAGYAAYDHDRGVNAAGRTVTLYGNPGPTLEEQAAARKKAQEDKRLKARKKAEAIAKARAEKQARAVAPGRNRPAAAKPAKPGFWEMLRDPSAAAAQQQSRPQPKPARKLTPAQLAKVTPEQRARMASADGQPR